MSAEAQVSQEQEKSQGVANDKELNFRNLEAKYKRQLEQELLEKEQIKRELEEAKKIQQRALQHEDDDDDSEPYVDKKKLKKETAKLGQQIKQETQSDIQRAIHQALQEDRKKSWLENNPDFYETLQNHAEKLAQRAPKLAESILSMPDGFERQKLVYNNIKALSLDKPEQKQSSIQEKIDANRKSPYYQPSGIAPAPYAAASDFSDAGQKNAYQKMQELKKNLRI